MDQVLPIRLFDRVPGGKRRKAKGSLRREVRADLTLNISSVNGNHTRRTCCAVHTTNTGQTEDTLFLQIHVPHSPKDVEDIFLGASRTCSPHVVSELEGLF